MNNYKALFSVILICLIILLSCSVRAERGMFGRTKVIVTTKLHNVSKSDIERVKKEAEKALKSVCPILGISYNKPIEIRIVENAISSSRGGVVTLDIKRVRRKTAPIVHEVTHIITRHGDNRFFAEGLAIYFQERFGEDDHGQFSTKHRSLDDWVRDYKNSLMPLNYLANNNAIFRDLDNEKRKIAYLQAGSFISFLVEKYGEKKLKDLHNSPALIYKKIYGKKLNKLEYKWEKHVFKKEKKGGTGRSNVK